MPGPVALDASVYINAFNSQEQGHATSRELLSKLQSQAIPLIAPALLLPEVAAAIRRGSGDRSLAQRFSEALVRLPHLVLVTIDRQLALQAVMVASEHQLRGSDAIYIAAALRFNCPLVTLDKQQHDCSAGVISTLYPDEALRSLFSARQ